MSELAAANGPLRIGDVDPRRVAQALRGKGLWLDVGAATIRVRSRSPLLPAQIQVTYHAFPFIDLAPWADVHATVDPVPGLRRWLRPQVQFAVDGRRPFEPFVAGHPLPMFEWGVNMFIGQYLHHLLLLHAAVVERDGRALVLPALPGSGKSTLCAALATSGWRLLSDEFGAFDLEAGVFRAMLKPVALKNRSIDVIRAHAPDAVLGPVFAKTRKGDVAHLAPSRDAVDRRHDPVPPGAIVLPRWVDGAELQLRPLSTEATFRSLAFNAFNYQTIGAAAFNAVVSLTRVVPAWQLAYGRLDDALVALDRLWQRDVGPIPGAR